VTFNVEIQNEGQYPVDAARLAATAETVLAQHQRATDSTFTIVITSNEQVVALNQQYRGIDASTDVLSFPADAPPVEIPGEPPYLGDLIIAYPYAAEQAEREKHPLADSLALLVVHGTLHLLGYDHDTPENRAAMWKAQETALLALGIAPDIVPALESKLDDD
jgi:probable rRNA maturation factor